jgi:hypothetical protein
MASADTAPIVILAWPLPHDDDKNYVPLAPESAGGIVVGWNVTIPTPNNTMMNVVVCAGILSNSYSIQAVSETIETFKRHHDDSCSYCRCNLEVLGMWKGGDDCSSLPRFHDDAATGAPWWWQSSSTTTAQHHQQQQLLLYRHVSGLNHYRHCTPWNNGQTLFSTQICRCMSEAESTVQFLENRLKHQGDGGASESPTSDMHESFEAAGVPLNSTVPTFSSSETGKGNIGQRLVRFVNRNSLIVLHAKRFSETSWLTSLPRQFPTMELFVRLLTQQFFETAPVRFGSTTQHEQAQSYIDAFDRAFSVAVDGLLGLFVGIVIINSTSRLVSSFDKAWALFHDANLRQGIQWLETFPVGFKLNVPLTRNMGREITMLVQLQDNISSVIWGILPKEWLVRLLGCVSIFFGYTALAATLFDLLSIITAHIAIIATCFRAMHQCQLYLLAALWRLFRGKKKNVLRHRTDTMEYDSMQLLLGMILFTAVIFLFTTIFVYYAFFAILDVTIRLVAVILWFNYVLVRFNPMGKCILRARHPGWFTERLYLLEDTKLSSDSSRPVTHLKMVPRSFSSLIAESLSPYLTPPTRCIPLLIWEFISGAPCSLYQECLRSLPVTRPPYR